MKIADTVEENGENPEKDQDEKEEVEQTAGKGEMAEDDVMKLVPPVSTMINVRVRSSHGSIDCHREFDIRIQQG